MPRRPPLAPWPALLAFALLSARPARAAAPVRLVPTASRPALVTALRVPTTPLSDLQSRGFAQLAPEQWLALPAQARVLEAAAAAKPDPEAGYASAPLYAEGNWRDSPAELREAVSSLTSGLRESLPDESFELHSVELRSGYSSPAEAAGSGTGRIHHDGLYMTAVAALRRSGSSIWDDSRPGPVKERPTPEGSLSVLTNDERAAATGIPATLHSAEDIAPDRAVLLVRWARSGEDLAPPADPARRARDLRRAARAERARSRRR